MLEELKEQSKKKDVSPFLNHESHGAGIAALSARSCRSRFEILAPQPQVARTRYQAPPPDR